MSPERISKKKSVEIQLVRRLRPGELDKPGEPSVFVGFVFFEAVLTVGERNDLFVVDEPDLTGLIATAGDSPDEAIEEFASAFRALVDFHLEEGTFRGFADRHLTQTPTTKYRTVSKTPSRLYPSTEIGKRAEWELKTRECESDRAR